MPRRLSPTDGLAMLKALAARLGRTPARRECCKENGCPSYRWFQLEFGSYAASCRLAGLEPRNMGENINRRRGCLEWDKRRHRIPPIDPTKAQQITLEKQDFWRRKNAEIEPAVQSEWVHPYRRRAQRGHNKLSLSGAA